MKQIAVVSGKGGTGKTSLVASLASLGRPLVAVDCDVDAANLALLIPGGLDGAHQPFYNGLQASVDPRICSGCGTCRQTCRFGAVGQEASGKALMDPFSCEGCGACVLSCPEGALELFPRLAGVWTTRPTDTGPLVHAILGVAQENSGDLVTRVRQEAVTLASAQGLECVLIDGPPGIGRPVRETIRGADLVLAVAEATISGEQDLQRVLALAGRSAGALAVIINKADLDQSAGDRIEAIAEAAGASVLGRLPFDEEVPRALSRGEPPLAVAALAEPLRRIWSRVQKLVDIQ